MTECATSESYACDCYAAATVEPEYEYGWRLTESDNGDFYDESVSSDETWSTPEVAIAQALQAKRDADSEELPPLVVTLLKRTKAGPWEPVPDTNEGAQP